MNAHCEAGRPRTKADSLGVLVRDSTRSLENASGEMFSQIPLISILEVQHSHKKKFKLVGKTDRYREEWHTTSTITHPSV
jgi:hypothetical protein